MGTTWGVVGWRKTGLCLEGGFLVFGLDWGCVGGGIGGDVGKALCVF